MTIIIGAELDDGRRILVGDGNVIGSNGGVRSTQHVKLRRVQGTFKKREALIGVAGRPVDLEIFADVVNSYLNTPEPRFADIFYKLSERYTSIPFEYDANAVMWLPDDEGKPHLVCVDGNMFCLEITEHRWHAEGSAGVEAGSALLGLSMRNFDNEPFRPSWNDVDIAYHVACGMDPYCGGLRTVLTL